VSCGYFAAGLHPSILSIPVLRLDVAYNLNRRQAGLPDRVYFLCSLSWGFHFRHAGVGLRVGYNGGRLFVNSVAFFSFLPHSRVVSTSCLPDGEALFVTVDA
jgi:hypothetical protein